MNLDSITPIELANLVLLNFDDHTKTDLEDAFEKAGMSYEDLADKYHRLYLDTTFTLEKSLSYIKVVDESGCWYRLTELGLSVKKAGGHFKYLENLKTKSNIEVIRQNLNDRKLEYDVKNAKRVFKTYWCTFFISILRFYWL